MDEKTVAERRRRSDVPASGSGDLLSSGLRTPPLVYTVVEGEKAGTTIVTLIGPLTLYNLFKLQDELRRLDTPVTILDLEQMTYMDSAGLGLLVNGYVSAERQNRHFLLASVSERVGALLNLTQVDQVLPIFASVEAAEASL